VRRFVLLEGFSGAVVVLIFQGLEDFCGRDVEVLLFGLVPVVLVVVSVEFLLAELQLFVQEALFGYCLHHQRPHPHVLSNLIHVEVASFEGR
jgi:hypothetical protein